MRDDAPLPTPPRPPVAGAGHAVPRRQGERVWIDYGHELRIHGSPMVRWLYLAIGWLCVVSGAIGVVLPGWPTTIWMILATYFFARSSPRFYNWLMNHRVFGPLIRDWRDGKGMSARAKTMAVGTIVVTIGISVTIIPTLWVKGLLAGIAIVLCTYLLRLPTKPADAA